MSNTEGLKALEQLGRGMPLILVIIVTLIILGIVLYYFLDSGVKSGKKE